MPQKKTNRCADCGAPIYPRNTRCVACEGVHQRHTGSGPNPSGLCLCGCGQPTPIAKHSIERRGYIRGQPIKYLPGHYGKGHALDYVVDEQSGCWLSVLAPVKNGYRLVRIDGKSLGAHRAMYEKMVGPVPDGMELDHLCKNSRCINPAHLEPVTHAENSRRAIAKYTREQVREIRSFPADISTCEIARRLCIPRSSVQRIRSGTIWRDI